MPKQQITVSIYQGYTGAPKCVVWVNKIEYVLEIEDINALIKNSIERQGYEISKTNRQKYPRIKINHQQA